MPLSSISDMQAPDVLERMEEASNLHHLYNRHLAKFKDKGHERAPGIHASEVSKCYRQAVYTMRGEPKDIDSSDVETMAYWKKVMDQGTWIHDMVQTHFYEMAGDSKQLISFEAETKLHPDLQPMAAKWNIHSSCDGIFTFKERNPLTWRYDTKMRVGLEIKSSSDASFGKRREPEPAHIEQVHVYMAVLDLPLFWVMYFNKNNQNVTPATPPWLVRFDHKIWSRMEARFEDWNQHILAGTIPEMMPGSHCSFCPYKTPCGPPAKKTFTPRPRPVFNGRR